MPIFSEEPVTMKVGELLGRGERKSKEVAPVSKGSLEDATASSSADTEEEEENSHMSSISASTEDDMTSMGDEDSEDAERFERSLRQKHAKACKAMAVSDTKGRGRRLQTAWPVSS